MGSRPICDSTLPQSDRPKDPQTQVTQDFYKTCNLPMRWERPHWFNSYGSQKIPAPHPLYRSSYMDLGWFPPNIHTVPLGFFPSRQKFTRHLGACGMYRNSSLNTVMDPKPWGEK